MLGSGDDGASLSQTPSGIEQTKQHAIGAHTDEVVEVARHAPVVIDRRQFGPPEFRDVRMGRSADRGLFDMQESIHAKSSRELTTEFLQKLTKNCSRERPTQ